MRLEELDYSLPTRLIADRPAEPRDACRLMVVHRKTGAIEHRGFRELSSFLKAGDVLVLNSARVTPARFYARGPASKFEILVLDAGESSRCRALVKPAKKMRVGMRLSGIGTGNVFRVLSNTPAGQWELELEATGLSWRALLESEGHMPLPPYILKRRAETVDVPEDRVWYSDRIWYQTAYADRDGAIAAPTAGLHFSMEMLGQLEMLGVDAARIFLKVGMGTFQPVRAATVEEHRLLPEMYEVSADAARRIADARARGGRVVAVGTTAVRTLEFCALRDGVVQPGSGETGLLITPPYQFRAVDALITNFHLPKTTLLALVYAFAGAGLIREAYEKAVREKYRFFSYGDAMLIL